MQEWFRFPGGKPSHRTAIRRVFSSMISAGALRRSSPRNSGMTESKVRLEPPRISCQRSVFTAGLTELCPVQLLLAGMVSSLKMSFRIRSVLGDLGGNPARFIQPVQWRGEQINETFFERSQNVSKLHLVQRNHNNRVTFICARFHNSLVGGLFY